MSQLSAGRRQLLAFLRRHACRSIKAFSDEMHKRKEPLDALVNNAGVFLVEHNRTQEGFEVVQVGHCNTALILIST